jgi:hypothetical protein
MHPLGPLDVHIGWTGKTLKHIDEKIIKTY